MMSSYLKTSVFARPHEYHTSPFSKISTLESVFENLRLRCPKTPGTCEPVAVFGEKILRFRKYPATCGRGLIPRPHVCVFVLKTQLFLRFKKKLPAQSVFESFLFVHTIVEEEAGLRMCSTYTLRARERRTVIRNKEAWFLV